MQAFTARSTASWPPICCATSPIRTDSCALSARCCGPVRRLPYTNTRCVTHGSPPLVWNAVCAAIIIPSGRLRSGDAALYRYLRRSVNEFDGAAAFRDRLRATGFTNVHSQTMPGWQRNIVHTFLAEAPR